MTAFTGFPDDTWTLLPRIGSHDRRWLAEHRDTYRESVLEPARVLVAALADPLRAAVSPGLQAVPSVNGSIAPVINDARFATATECKDHVLLRFWEGDDKYSSSTLSLRLSANEIEFAAGRRFDASAIPDYRAAVAGPAGVALAGILAELRTARPALRITEPELRRVPAGYDPEHPRADLLRHRSLRVGWVESRPRCTTGHRFVPWITRRAALLADLHGWLRDCC